MDKKYLGLLIFSITLGLVSIGSFGIRSYKAKASEDEITAINEVEIDDGFVVFTEVVNNKPNEIAEAQVVTGNESVEVQNDTSSDNNTTKDNASTVSDQAEEQQTEVSRYYDTYSDVVTIEDSATYSAAQAMDINGDYAYYVKIDNSASSDEVRDSRIWAYNIKTGKKSVVYNENTNKTSFKIGHANCMCIKDGYMYIATMLINEPTIRKYKIVDTGNKIYLTDETKLSVYSDKANTKALKVTGIHYAQDLGGFLVKNGFNVYLGNFEGNVFNWTKHFKVDTNLTVKTSNGTENIDVSKFIQQSLYYKNGKMYFPMMNNNKSNQSLVVEYPISASTANESVIQESSNRFFRLTSTQCSKLFEIESVAEYNGEMYAVLNATYTGGGTCDRIIKFKDFKF